MAWFYHWWVSLFVVPGPNGEIDLQHAADTAGYWAQATGTVLAVFAAIGLAGYQQFVKRRDEKAETGHLHEAIVLIAVGMSDMLTKLCTRDLKSAQAAGDPNVVPRARRLAIEYHATLAAVPLVELAKADVVPQVHRLREAARDADQILAYIDGFAPQHALQVSIGQLELVKGRVSAILNTLRS
ncbi:hypothetical protein [Paraburkholderia fungorum]|jgi:hypothetical protein|uniref:Uncharacterized protein n=1 Tax=Paraburkholderia fungorum TaxID=134537 RepID=A0AAP5UY92_9BURK|nr:hypothetical protein [Paraburkholderia fungorum]MDT8841032.1 hypothetical protein [Paraburkholderia fungorum]PRZ56348.1 hypothetical protein BX589_102550 [Paraburkholderia fungorum]USU14202.1 hypothetical protein NFE55_11130 [Paraburkholderia fungorum]USU22150.1 hypothetical protein NFS19_11130 [Paraburkholderia fungorum]